MKRGMRAVYQGVSLWKWVVRMEVVVVFWLRMPWMRASIMRDDFIVLGWVGGMGMGTAWGVYSYFIALS